MIQRLLYLMPVALLFATATVHALTQTASPTSCVSTALSSNVDWTSPGNATASDNSYATASLAPSTATDYLQCTGFNFTIPTGATINGITVSIERMSSNPNTHRDNALQLIKSGARTGSDLADGTTEYPNSDGTASYGGSSSLWGTTWSATDINASNFGVAFSARNANGSGPSRTVSVDHISVTIDYTGATTPATLVARYRFEDAAWNGTTGELTDSGGYAGGPYNGKAVNTSMPTPASSSPARSGDPGTCGYSSHVSGSSTWGGGDDGYFQVTGLPVSTSAGAVTSLAFWVYWNDTDNDNVISFGNGKYGILFTSSRFGISTDTSNDTFGIANTSLKGGWHHVVAVLNNGSPASNKLYIDGALQTSSQSGTATSGNAYVASTLYIGGEGTTNTFEGRIDELHVYTGELTSTEVNTLYTTTHACSSCGTGSSTIALVASGAPSSVSASTVSSLSFTKPTGTANTNLLIAAVNAYRSGSSSCASITAPSGWTILREDTKSSSSFWSSYCMKQGIYYKLATASEPASYSFTLSTSAYATGAIATYSGVDTTTPIMNSSALTSGTSSSITAPSITTTRDGARMIGFFGTRKGNVTVDAPTCMTELVESPTGSSTGVTLEMSESPWGTSGATGTRVAAASGAAENIGQLVVIQPPPTPLTPGAYNAFDTTTASGSITGNIKTKIAGTAFNLSLVALNSGRTGLYTTGGGYAGTVKVELLGSSNPNAALDSNNCPTSSTSLHSGTLTFATGDASRKNYSVPAIAEAWPNVRVRISFPSTGTATTTSCSTDNFAIRPSSFTSVAAKDATWTTTGTARTLNNTSASGGVVHAAGRPFNLTATAANSSGTTTTNYTGTPTVSVTACPLPSGCAIDGTGTYAQGYLDPGTLTTSSGVVTSTDASYTEAGTVTIQFVDDSFASVDASDGSTSDCSGRYVCSAETTIGRFVPDHFELALNDPGGTAYPTPQLRTFGSTCATRSFTYVGQSFGYATVPKALVQAMSASGNVTANYLGLNSPAAVSISQTYTATPSSPAFDSSAKGTPTLTSYSDGTAELAVPNTASFLFTRGNPVAEFTAAINLSLSVSDAAEAAVANNGTIQTTVPADFSPLAFDAGDTFRYGRLRLFNAFGPATGSLAMQTQAQYWSGNSWVINAGDSCTSVPANAFAITSGLGVSASVLAFSAGTGTLTLSKSNTTTGSVDVAANLGATTANQSCVTGLPATTGASLSWLRSQNGSCAATYDRDPAAKATFGIYAPETRKSIHVRESF